MYAEHCEVAGETFQGAKDRFGTCAKSSILPHKCEAYDIARPIERALERDHFMTAKEALSFGIIDKIVERRPAPTSTDADGAGKDKQ